MLIYIPYIQYTLSHLSRQTSVHHSPLNLVLSLHLLHNYGSGSQHTSYQYCSAPWKPRQDTCRLCYCELIFCATLVFHPSLSVFSSSFYLKFTTQFNTVMHAISHSLAQRAHRGAPPATRTRARWQPYNAIQSLSARFSPAGYLHTPASSVSSASLTPPQALTASENDRLRNIIITPPVVSQTPTEVPIRDVQKSKYVIGLVGESEF